MKTLMTTTALAALMFSATVTTVQAEPAIGLWHKSEPLLLLAEGGSERAINYRLQQEHYLSNRSSQDSGERFAQLLEAQPTAAGNANEQQGQPREIREPSYHSPIHRDRGFYGGQH